MKFLGNIIKLSIYWAALLIFISYLTASSYAYESSTTKEEIPKTSTDMIVFSYKPSNEMIFKLEDLKNDGYAEAKETITLNLKSPEDKHTYCYYDLYLNFNGNLPDPITRDDSIFSPFYYRLKINSQNSYSKSQKTYELISLNEYDKNGLKRLKIASDEVISTSSEENVLYEFNNLIYKADLEALISFNEDIKAYIDVDSKGCFIKPFIAGLKHYMVLTDRGYEVVDRVPVNAKGERYTIDSKKTYCVKKGNVLGYDSITGKIKAPKDDECYIYFTKTL